jgi:hypothetical protein
MILEAVSPSCCSNTYVLKLDGRPWGEFCGRCFSECMYIRLIGHQELAFEKRGWSGSRFSLNNTADRSVLAEADRAGILTSAWDLRLANGPAKLVSAGWFNTGYQAVRANRVVARINKTGLFGNDWTIDGDGSLQRTDLLFIGLIYCTILRRNAAASATMVSSS